MRASRRKSSEVAASQAAYRKVKERARARSAALTLAGQDIAPLPPVKDPLRRQRGDEDFRFFCETYFPHLFALAWSDDHLRVIAKVERVVKLRETLAVAMPRGSGKTTLCQVAVIWAIVSGRHHFVILIAATDEEAGKLLSNIKSHTSSNERLLEDYPEAVYPIRCLEGETRRANGQRYYGVPTRIKWGEDEIVMPTIPGSRSSGAIIRVRGITGQIRGALYTTPQGRQYRPSLVICDDPQTDQSAKSPLQTGDRLSIVNGAIRGLAGPGEQTAIIIPCTVIATGDLADQLLSRQENPDWHGERTKMVYQWPTAAKLWAEYARIREESLRADGDGHEATGFYREHRAEMDEGSIVAWPARFLPGELSAIQHAWNIRLKIKDPAFFAEYQNEPLNLQTGEATLTAAEIAERWNGHRRSDVPKKASHLTAFIDVHDRLLYWMVCAWATDFTGWVVEYGTFPDQRRTYFSHKEAKYALGELYTGTGREGAIQAGLKAFSAQLLDKTWKKDDGQLVQVGRAFIDAGYVPELVFSAVRQTARLTILMPSKGVGIGPDAKPFSEYRKMPGEQYGLHWRIPSTRGTRELATVSIDTNYWKSFVHDRLATAHGDPGSLTLYGIKGTDHRLLGEHLASESRVRTQGRRRIVDVWKAKPTISDNHWLDCLVGCAAAASMLGCTLPGFDLTDGRMARGARVKLSRIQRRTG